VIGVMTESTEASVDQGKAALNGERRRQHWFKAIRASVADGADTARVARVAFDQDFTLPDVEAVLHRLPEGGEPTAQIQVPSGASDGLLAALADLIHADVATARSTGRGTRGLSQAFVYDRGLHDLTLLWSAVVRSLQIGLATYRDCHRNDGPPVPVADVSFPPAWLLEVVIPAARIRRRSPALRKSRDSRTACRTSAIAPC
jgi:hypothetical protein